MKNLELGFIFKVSGGSTGRKDTLNGKTCENVHT